MKKLRVTIEGKSYDVTVEVLDGGTPAAVATTTTATVATPPTPPPVRATASPGSVVSPLAGKVVSIDVKVGGTVNEGAQVATIEAMKMNTYIFAPVAGRVSAVHARAGDGVEEGAPLLQIN